MFMVFLECLEALTVRTGNGEIVKYHGRDNEVAGANNDINVLDNSSLFNDLLVDIAHVAPFVVNGVGFERGIT
ncbi:ALP1-like protein [Tanacetum coccineum]